MILLTATAGAVRANEVGAADWRRSACVDWALNVDMRIGQLSNAFLLDEDMMIAVRREIATASATCSSGDPEVALKRFAALAVLLDEIGDDEWPPMR